jgi:cyclic-di-GMP-binding protein
MSLQSKIEAMAQTVSFDITSTVDLQEVDNAVNQARKEITQRYDFKGSPVEIELKKAENVIEVQAEDKFKLEAVWEVLAGKMVKRGVPVKNLKRGDPQAASGSTVRQTVTLQQGIPIETSRDIVKFLKDQKLKKVQAAIQADQVRVSSPSKDELQDAMRRLRDRDFGIDLQFGNYRG